MTASAVCSGIPLPATLAAEEEHPIATTTIHWHGTRAELRQRLGTLVRVLTGKEPDTSGVVESMQLALGEVMLSKIKEAFVVKSQGGTDEMGIAWPPLSATTLALRTKNTGAKTMAKLDREFQWLPKHRRFLIAAHRERLESLYQDGVTGGRARRHASRILRLMQPYLPPTRFKKLEKELKEQPTTRAKKLAQAGAYAEILRDTGRFLNSFAGGQANPDRKLYSGPGVIVIGSNARTKTGIPLLDLHDSAGPRAKKADGTDRLPRRQILPDEERRIPATWWRDGKRAYAKAMNSRPLWLMALGDKAS